MSDNSEARGDSGAMGHFAGIHERLGQHLHEVFSASGTESSVQEAYAAYLGVLQGPWADAEFIRRAGTAHDEWSATMHSALAGGRAERALAAYREYVRNLKEAWAGIDPESITPEALAAVAQGMAWAAAAGLEAARARPGRGPADPS